jgi:hypothetical protein
MEYKCTEIDYTPVYLNVTASNEPMDYLGQSFYIYKYDLMIGAARYHSFYTYKFNRRLYLLDEDAKMINYTRDQILFDLNEDNRILDKASGVFSDVELQLDDKLKLNEKSFYFYSSTSIAFSYFNITRVIFDDQLDINQMEIKSYLGTSQCVLSNIIIELKDKNKPRPALKSNKNNVSKSIKEIKFKSKWDKN